MIRYVKGFKVVFNVSVMPMFECRVNGLKTREVSTGISTAIIIDKRFY
jgi:hypothetical protein